MSVWGDDASGAVTEIVSLFRQPLICLCLALATALAANPVESLAKENVSQPQFLWGLVSPGEDPSDLGKDGVDDVGPPRAVRQKWARQSGATFWGVTAHWIDAEPKRLQDSASQEGFEWAKFDSELDAIPVGKASHCAFKLDAPWAQELEKTDEKQYWQLAERFIELAARRARARGVRYYGVPGNEMSLTGRPDWAEPYMGPVRHYAQAIHRANPDNQVIAGALVCGARDLIDELYKRGFKENCDVLDIHAYAGSPGESRYHVGLGQILEAHQALVDHGDGHKRIFLGEGWSVFPLPAHLDKLKQPPKYSAEDIQHYRNAVVNGYAALTTPRPDYDPKWILGAKFFCLNDHWGSMSWKKRATIERNKDGDPAFWILDGYKLPYAPDAMEPQFRAWGLIDIDGNPKGETIKHFPPRIPSSSIRAEFVDNPSGTVFPRVPYKVRITCTDKESDPCENLRFSMDVFQGAGRKDVEFRDLGGPGPTSIPSGGSSIHDFEITAKPNLVGRELRVQGGCEYDWHGEPYYADGWLKLRVASPGTFQLKPCNPMPGSASEPITLAYAITSQTGQPLPNELQVGAGDQVTVSQSSIDTGPKSRDYSVVLTKKDLSAGGFYTVEAIAGSSFESIRTDIAFPNPGRKPEKSPARGRLINPGFEEFGPGSGFEGWDGPPSNFDDPAIAADLPDHGKRMIAKVYNNTKYPAENSQMVLVPADFRAGGTVRASVWTKGIAFANATDHDSLRFRITVAFLGTGGKELGREDSQFLKGTGKWEKLEFTTSAAPHGTEAIRLIILHENTNPASWHKAALDKVELRFD